MLFRVIKDGEDDLWNIYIINDKDRCFIGCTYTKIGAKIFCYKYARRKNVRFSDKYSFDYEVKL